VSLIVARKVVVDGPLLDLFDLAIGATVAVLPVTIPLLEKPLLIRLQFVVQDHAMDVRALPAQALRLVQIGAIDLSIVFQFTWSLDTGVECLPVRGVAVMARRFQKVATLLGQRDDGGVAVESNRVDQPGFPEVPQLAIAGVEGIVEFVAQVIRWHDAEGADRGQRARFGATQRVVMVANVDVFSVRAAREVDVLQEHVAARVRPNHHDCLG
jgi:hypothetical protein